MKSLLSRLEATWGIKKEFRLKVFLLTLSFFMLTACQAIWRPIKAATFITIVGVKYIPDAKFFLMFPLFILIIIYSKLVDWLRRHQLFYWFAISHALVGVVIYFFLKDPYYGLGNTAQSPSRIFGWLFYFFMESFGAFMSTAFWSFANSINKPKDARNYYGLLVVGSKVGGVLGAGTTLYIAKVIAPKATILIPNLVLVGSGLLLLSTGAIYLLMKYVPGYLMHGYEAAYQYEKKKKDEKKSILQSIKEAFDGILLIFSNSYVLGILAVSLSYEIIIVIADYLVSVAAAQQHTTATGLVGFFTLSMLLMHSIGLLIALFGTTPIQRFLGIRLSLFIPPLASVIILPILYIYSQSLMVIFLSMVILRAINYGLNHPSREALFIPTTKAVKFKAKAWSDTIGGRSGKALGSLLNKHLLFGIVRRSAVFNMGIVSFWLVVTYFLGRTYQKTVANNQVIGAEETEPES